MENKAKAPAVIEAVSDSQETFKDDNNAGEKFAPRRDEKRFDSLAWSLILDYLEPRDLSTLFVTSQGFRKLISSTTRLMTKIVEFLRSSDKDTALTVEDIRTAELLIESSHLPADFIIQIADLDEEALWRPEQPTPTPILSTAASLAKMGYITDVMGMWLEEIDISSIPSDNIAALTSVVTGSVNITKVTGNIRTILASIKSRLLRIDNMTLDHDETECLLETMRTNVEKVSLWSDVSLDIDVFTQYDGTGQCSDLFCWEDRYLDTLTSWAQEVGWMKKGRCEFRRQRQSLRLKAKALKMSS